MTVTGCLKIKKLLSAKGKFQFVELNSIYPIGARLKYTLLLFIGYSTKMNKKVIYAYQYLSNTETFIIYLYINLGAIFP